MAEDGFTPVFATEIEFYLPGASAILSDTVVLDRLRTLCESAGLSLFSLEKERGCDQFEIALRPAADIARLIYDTERFKLLLADHFASLGLTPDFGARPYPGTYGSGLHVHIHLEDKTGRNCFTRDADGFSTPLLHALGGLLTTMKHHMTAFAPYPESYARFHAGTNAPTHIAWCTNNRTTALRLPAKPMDNKHIEHRVAGSDADVGRVIGAIVRGIRYGLLHKSDPGEPVYGDASLPQYGKEKLPSSLEEAVHQATLEPN